MGLLFLLKVDILPFAVTTKLIHKTPFLFCGFRNFVFCIAGHRTAVLRKCDLEFTCIIVNSRSHVKELHRFVATGKERQRFIPRRASVIRVESDKSNPRIANFLVTRALKNGFYCVTSAERCAFLLAKNLYKSLDFSCAIA